MNAAERNRQHMEQVRAIHRRSAYERVSAKVERLDELLRAAELGLTALPVEECRAELGALRELRDSLWRGMIEAGQVVDLSAS